MFGLGTIINVTAIVAGGVMGLLFGKKLTERYQSNLMMASALCVLFIGVSGCMEQMLKLTENGLSSSGSMMMIACFAVGALLGEWIDLDTKMERFGEWLKEKTKSDGDNAFVDAFVTASLTVCIGAMAVVGSIPGRNLRRLFDSHGKSCSRHDHRRDHDGVHGKRLYFLGDPGRDVPGGDDAPCEGDRAVPDG